jgi:uncharacterized protein
MTWSKDSLTALAESQASWVVEAEGECLTISNDEGIDAFVYAGGSQIIVETTLFPASQVKDPAALNALVLRTHQLLPLTTICINEINGEEYYVAFGSMSVESKDSVVIEEVETLFANVGEFLELYGKLLIQENAA